MEASKIMSEAVYDRMIAEYSFLDDAREMEALRAFWAREYGVVFSVTPQDSPEFLNLGKAVDADNCASCHSDTASAFVSRSLASGLFFTARAMNTSRADLVFRHVHLGLCFLGLALLPFGKFFHPVAVSANLLVRQGKHVAERAESSGIGSGVGLDACSRCGECSLHCSVAPVFAVLGNADILPSEKLRSLNRHAVDGLDGRALELFAEGSRICTECLRCTDICPSGMDLQSLWMASREHLAQGRTAGPNAEIRMGHPKGWATAFMEMGEFEAERTGGDGLADRAESYWACVQCTTCTSVCPVVAVSSDPTRDLDFTPQQIMNLLRMGLKDQALGVRMVWSCTTCYKCQEHCPQNIPVADVLYELRNVAAARLREQREKREGR
ncbi:4Fe-4S dicluster domain-containing protein [Pseudodesulfovibrio tunisiensis]|uniref:4Fe-4S dicluster domain-containing protein n=1 Tax=Pseudodesulfovibrio tunisiensis TaxID=463192 RepID=UPI001FB289D2|nr:4Fe-4S dicluster domain-containing protein [Pseudodesulfovibrio tunisiensis]